MTVTLSRLLPDATKLGREVLMQSGAPCSHDVPDLLASKVPCFTFYRFGGAAVHPALLDKATCHLISWGGTYEQARDLAETARVLLWQAWQGRWSTTNGVLVKVKEINAASEIRTQGQADNVFRFDSDFSLWVQPAQS